ncbi:MULTISPECIES: hypothetical protein [Methylobacterium]
MRDIKHHALTSSRNFVLAAMVTAANVHAKQAVGRVPDHEAGQSAFQ